MAASRPGIMDARSRTSSTTGSGPGSGSGSIAAPVARPAPVIRLERLRDESLALGGSDRIARQRAKGKLTARERLDVLLDPGSFIEIDALIRPQGSTRALPIDSFPGDGVVAGFGKIHGREVAVYAQDFTVLGGSLGAAQARKICKVLDQAHASGVPVIGLNDSGGARIQEGVESLAGYGEIFFRNASLSGVVPQITLILGPCAGGAVYSPALTDLIIMAKGTSHMFVTGPDVVKKVMGEETTAEDLGGADLHATASGVAHLVGEDEVDAISRARDILSYLPQNHLEMPPRLEPVDAPSGSDDALEAIIPDDSRVPYDAHTVVEGIVDGGHFLEVQPDYAPNLITALARIDGRSVAILANQPKVLAGCLDSRASEKGARFIRFADSFNIPVISLVDVPGFLPGLEEEHGGVIRRGAKLLYAYCEATVPKLTVITRKAYGGAYIVMASKHLRTDVNLAWPQAEIAVLGAESAVEIIHRRELTHADDEAAARAILEASYKERFGDPYFAAELGYVDEVIRPRETRQRLARHLERLATKHDERPARKHANNPQ